MDFSVYLVYPEIFSQGRLFFSAVTENTDGQETAALHKARPSVHTVTGSPALTNDTIPFRNTIQQ